MSVKKAGKIDFTILRSIIGIFYYGILVIALAIKIAAEMIFKNITKKG
ncbi:MAG: hypothetical protein AAB465_03330 [Patescibacteria group bacterium]